MNLYIVITSWDYEGGRIEGVYTSQVKADKRLVEVSKGYGDWHHIVKVEANVDTLIQIPTEDETEVKTSG
jgi:hypothetical protein